MNNILRLKPDSLFWMLSLIYVLQSLSSCGSQGKLTGGPPDEDEPVIVKSKSTASHQINFYPKEIVLEFDEFIEVKNAIKEIIVSPPMVQLPDIKHRGKKITFKFPEDEPLKEDATYVINFGKAIKDYRAGNQLKNFSFIFSTGDYIDSLSINGKIRNTADGKPAKDIIVMLFENLSDSIVYKERPFYFSRSDSKGDWQIDNIKAGTFKIFALDDGNLNYKLDEGEQLAFLDTNVVINDSSFLDLHLELFRPEQQLKILDKYVDKNGIVKLELNKKLNALPDIAFSDSINYSVFVKEDSLLLYHDTTSVYPFELMLAQDTIKIFPRAKAKKLRFKSIENAKSLQAISNTSFQLNFDFPILRLEKDSISVLDTAKHKIDFLVSIDSNDQRTIWIDSLLDLSFEYILEMRAGALYSYNKIANDTLSYSLKFIDQESLSILHFNTTNLDSTQQYLLQLFDKQKLISQHIIPINSNKEKITIKGLDPKSYHYILIEDRNSNGNWDTGNYELKYQPERRKQGNIEKIRPNWESEIVLEANFEK